MTWPYFWESLGSSHSMNYMQDPLHIRCGLFKQVFKTLLPQSHLHLEPHSRNILPDDTVSCPRQLHECHPSLTCSSRKQPYTTSIVMESFTPRGSWFNSTLERVQLSLARLILCLSILDKVDPSTGCGISLTISSEPSNADSKYDIRSLKPRSLSWA